MMNFTNDEMNLMCIYDAGTRTGLMSALSDMRKELSADEIELLALTDSTLKKLSAMTDEDYDKLELYPDFDEYSRYTPIFRIICRQVTDFLVFTEKLKTIMRIIS